ncbi:hypothetical protein ACTWP6_17300 [Mycobacterium sp. 4D054]|uniref:hypothetical protein n=1 Tax=unclassified Mycobacterium TaxID=2642494 RepID=UPI0021B2372A|nr:hypothetical protein [Mycobacterium sp. SMC-8]UXA10241.1 hypothetical protein KXD97_19075 [Mycobacterium sp. SMC-8]
MSKQIPKLWAMLAAAAVVFGLVWVAPAAVPTLAPSMTPVANADVLPNGYDVNCTKSNDGQVVCTIAGCPRVHEDLAGDVVHTKINGGPQAELDKACGNVTTQVVNTSSGFNLAIQGCRKSTFGSDDCGAWSDYRYTPPAPPAPQVVQCPPGSKSATVPVGQQCQLADVQCPPGSKSPTVPAGQTCALAQKNCPPGSLSATVPGDQQCAAPTNAVSMNVTRAGLNANVAVTNKSALPAECAYTATRTSGLLGPETVNRNVSVGANSTGNITDLLWPPPLVSYRATVRCTADYDGKQVTIGESTQNVSG